MDELTVTNIQRFSLHDGPGIRTVVFFKGCSLHCPWCSNPENISFDLQKYKKESCVGVFGKKMTCDQLFHEIMKDIKYYQFEGGVTLSGGECLLQIKKCEPLLKKLNEKNIHTAVETSLFAPEEMLQLAQQYIDLYYVDLKILDKEKCESILGGDLSVFFRNYNSLMKSGKSVVVRVPVISGYTDSDVNTSAVIEFLKESDGNIKKVELIKEHNLGIEKYKYLVDGGNDVVIPSYGYVSDNMLEEYRDKLSLACNIPVDVCSF